MRKLGYLKSDDFEDISFGTSNTCVDYGALFVNHRRLLNRAFDRFMQDVPADFEKFCHDHAEWLNPYAEFMSLKEEFGHKAYWEWPELYQHRNETTAKEIKKLQKSVLYHKMTQYFFFTQWAKVKTYANKRGVLYNW